MSSVVAKKSHWMRHLLIIGGGGGLIGGVVAYKMYQSRLQDNRRITAEDFNMKQNQTLLDYSLRNMAYKGNKRLKQGIVPLDGEDRNGFVPNNQEVSFVQKAGTNFQSSIPLLYRYTTCPWCGTVTAFLDYYKIRYVPVEVEPMMKRELSHMVYRKVPQLQIVNALPEGEAFAKVDSRKKQDTKNAPFTTNMKKHTISMINNSVITGYIKQYVPGIIIEPVNGIPQTTDNAEWGPFIVDSDLIIRKMSEYVPNPGAGKGHMLQEQLNDPEIKRWRTWSRNGLVRFIVLNINRSLIEAWRGYEYIDNFDTIPWFNKLFLKIVGAPAMYLVSELKTKPALKEAGMLKDKDDVRLKLDNLINEFVKDCLGRDAENQKAILKEYHGGKHPDLADIDVYGVMQSIRGHKLYKSLVNNNKEFAAWLARMDVETGKVPGEYYYH